MSKRKKRIINIALISVIIVGACIVLYPIISNLIYTRQSQNLITTYKARVNDLQGSFIEEEWQKAVDYNESLLGHRPATDPFVAGSGMALAGDYMNILNVNGIMGYLDIPRLNIHLPVYHTTSEPVLKKGVGHLQSTPLPIGMEGVNPILSAHTGLPSARLFTDLIDMKPGDIFSVRVMDRTMYYKTDDVKVILPSEISSLVAVPGKDLITLVTCTPLGINSHRLVVRGERCYEIADSLTLEQESRAMWWFILAGSGLFAAVFTGIIIIMNLQKRKQTTSHESN